MGSISTSPQSMDGESLTVEHIKSLRIAKLFRDSTKRITSLAFDDTGEWCITASEDESMNLYECRSGKNRKTLYSKKYGVDHVRFSHSSTAVVHASTKGDHALRYLNLHDNKYLRYFNGHTQKVTWVDVSPVSDLVLSAAMNDSVRLWDLRQSTAVAQLPVQGRACVAFDPDGLVFAVGLNSRELKFYDAKSLSRGPFLSCNLQGSGDDAWTNLQFSRDGNQLLIGTRQPVIHLVDAFTGQVTKSLRGHLNNTQLKLYASFTPDAQYVVCGSQDGTVHIWDAMSGGHLHALEGHTNTTMNVLFNPKYMMLASACTNVAFWLPDI